MCCLCSALCDQSGTARAPRSTVAVAFCGFFFFLGCCTTFDDIFLCISSQRLPGE